MKQFFDLTARNLTLTQALDNNTGMLCLHSVGLHTAHIRATIRIAPIHLLRSVLRALARDVRPDISHPTDNSTAGTEGSMIGGGAGMVGSSLVNATITTMMQKYLFSFVLASNQNTVSSVGCTGQNTISVTSPWAHGLCSTILSIWARMVWQLHRMAILIEALWYYDHGGRCTRNDSPAAALAQDPSCKVSSVCRYRC